MSVPAIAALTVAQATLAQTPLTTVRVASGLTNPIFATAPEGDPDRVFILEWHTGLVRILQNGVIDPTPFIDVSSKMITNGDHGLMGMTFHPEYASNGFAYLYYSVPGPATAVVRYTVMAGDPNRLDPATEATIITIPQPNTNHNGGSIEFSPVSGFLYIALGDGGGQNDPNCNGQNPGTWLSKILRIDVDGGFPYVVPPSNPFVGQGGFLPEIWALGMRNPWRFSFDRGNGDLYIGDNGQGLMEEVDFEPAGFPGGANYGWSVMEGTLCFGSSSCPGGTPPCHDPVYTDPLYEYDHSQGCSVQGGYVYRGCAVTDLGGTYFFADWCTDGATNGIWSFEVVAGAVTNFKNRTAELAPGGGLSITSIVAFGQDGLGELYIVDFVDGELFKIVPDAPFDDCNDNGVPDQCEPDSDGDGVIDDCELGTNYCTPAVPNSSGVPAQITGFGSDVVTDNDFHLLASDVPINKFGYFLGSASQGFIQSPPGSVGNLCLSGQIGRFAKLIQNSGAEGAFSIQVDLTLLPPPLNTPVLPGSTWNFQAWYRDVGNVSNFTDGVEVLFQ